MRILYVRDRFGVHDERFLRAIARQGHDAAPVRLGEFRGDAPADVVMAGPIPAIAAPVADALPPSVPLVVVSWGSDILIGCRDAGVRREASRAIGRAQVMLVDCEAVRDEVLSWRPERVPQFVRFPWGLELGPYDERAAAAGASLRRELGWHDATVFLSSRSWEPGYGIETLVEAFAMLARERADARLLLLGDGSLRQRVDARIDALGLDDRVHRPGRIAETDLPAWHRAADVYVSSSLCDGTSVSLLEAMASARPVIVHGEYGNVEWVRPEENGWLVDCNSAASIAAGLRTAIARRGEWGRIGATNRDRVFRDADWSRNSLALSDAFERAVRAARAGGRA